MLLGFLQDRCVLLHVNVPLECSYAHCFACSQLKHFAMRLTRREREKEKLCDWICFLCCHCVCVCEKNGKTKFTHTIAITRAITTAASERIFENERERQTSVLKYTKCTSNEINNILTHIFDGMRRKADRKRRTNERKEKRKESSPWGIDWRRYIYYVLYSKWNRAFSSYFCCCCCYSFHFILVSRSPIWTSWVDTHNRHLIQDRLSKIRVFRYIFFFFLFIVILSWRWNDGISLLHSQVTCRLL